MTPKEELEQQKASLGGNPEITDALFDRTMEQAGISDQESLSPSEPLTPEPPQQETQNIQEQATHALENAEQAAQAERVTTFNDDEIAKQNSQKAREDYLQKQAQEVKQDRLNQDKPQGYESPSIQNTQDLMQPSTNYGDFNAMANKKTQNKSLPNPYENRNKKKEGLAEAAKSGDPSQALGAAGKMAAEKLGGENTGLGRMAGKAASVGEDAANMARLAGGDITALKGLATKHKKEIKLILISALLILLPLFALLLSLVLGNKSIEFGNAPGGVAGSPSGFGTVGSVATVDTLDGLKIPYPETFMGLEAPACDQGVTGGIAARKDSKRIDRQCEGDPGDTLFGASSVKVVSLGGKTMPASSGSTAGKKLRFRYGPSTPEQAMWYMNEPWPSDPSNKYAHKKVVITAVGSGKQVVASVEESGPGVCDKSNPTTSRCAGISPDGLKALGWGGSDDKKNKVHIAFAADQNVALGPVTAAAVGTIPADKGICSFCIQKPLEGLDTSDRYNHNYGVPKAIILHYLSHTGSNATPLHTLNSAWTYFNGDNSKHVQFMVGRDGSIWQLEPETHQAAGACGYNTLDGGITISIENEGSFEDGPEDKDFSKSKPTDIQIKANTKLVKHLMERYHIPKSSVISHGTAYKRGHAVGATYIDGVTPCEARSDPGDLFMRDVTGKL